MKLETVVHVSDLEWAVVLRNQGSAMGTKEELAGLRTCLAGAFPARFCMYMGKPAVLDAIEHDTPIIYHGRHHVGISNIKRRLALMYGERASITCSNMDENYGAVVEVRLSKTE